MTLSAIQHLCEQGLLSGGEALLADLGQYVGRQHDAVKPLDMIPATSAADETHVRSKDLGSDIGNEVFRESVGIWRTARFFLHCHFRNFPNRLPHEALGDSGITSTLLKIESDFSVKIFRRVASCLALKQFARFRAYGAA